jgi:hypothetical protein
VSSEIIDFYRKANIKKRNKVVDNVSDVSPPILNARSLAIESVDSDAFGKFFLTLAETLKREKETKDKFTSVEETTTDVSNVSDPQTVTPTTEAEAVKDLDVEIFDEVDLSEEQKQPVLAEDKIKQAALDFITALKKPSTDNTNKRESLPEKFINKLAKALDKQEVIVKDVVEHSTQTLSEDVSEDKLLESKNEQGNPYVAQLISADKNHSKTQTKIEKISDIKGVIAQQIKEEFNRLRQQYPNLGLGSGSGGGTNAVQYANGGTMNGDLNVNGRYLSGGVDIASAFQQDRIVAGDNSLVLNLDGSVSFPDQTLAAPQEEMLTIVSSNTSVNAFTKITLSPYGFFVYDENSNSITFDTVDNDIVLTTLDDNEWKFSSEGVLTGPNGTLVVQDFDSHGKILSGGKDLADIFLTSETVSQTLSFNSNTKDLSLSNGNTISLSSLVDSETYFSQASSKYENLITLVQSNSANWAIDNSTDTQLRALSSNWQTAYAYVSANSINLSATTITVRNKLTVTNSVSSKLYYGTLIDWMTLVRGFNEEPTLIQSTPDGEVYRYTYTEGSSNRVYYRYISNDNTQDGFYETYTGDVLNNLIASKSISF